MEADVTALEETEKSADFLVMGNVFYKGDKGIPHSHVVGVSFMNEANGRLGVNGMISGGGKMGILESSI